MRKVGRYAVIVSAEEATRAFSWPSTSTLMRMPFSVASGVAPSRATMSARVVIDAHPILGVGVVDRPEVGQGRAVGGAGIRIVPVSPTPSRCTWTRPTRSLPMTLPRAAR